MNEARFRAVMDDKVSSKIDKIRDGFDKAFGHGSSASLFGNVGAKAVEKGFSLVERAGEKVVDVLKDSIEHAIADEESIAKLGQALRANVKDWDGNQEAIERVLKARIALGFSDEEQRDSLALLVAATKNEQKALEQQRLAMDLARLKRISLADATAALVKVDAGSFRVLKSLGIQLDKNATKEEALRKIQQVAAGQAETYANTTAGKLAIAQIKWGELLEKLGYKLLPVVTEALDGLISTIDAAMPLIDTMADFAGNAGKAFEFWGEKVEFVLDVMTPWDGQFHEHANSVKALEHSFSEASDRMTAKSVAVSGAAIGMANALPKQMETAKDEAVKIARETPGEIAAAFLSRQQIWEDAVDVARQTAEDALTKTAEIANIQGFLTSKELAEGLRDGRPAVQQAWKQAQQDAQQRLHELSEGGRKAGKDTTLNYASGLTSGIPAVNQAVNKIAKAVSKYLKISSPAETGPLSKGGGPEGWGKRAVRLWADGGESQLARVNSVLSRMTGPGVGTPALAGVGAIGTGRGVKRDVVINLNGREFARATIDDLDEELYWRNAGSGGATLEG